MSNPITVAIIDDEPNAIVTIELILKEFCPNLHIVTTANTVDQAWELIKQHQPDLVFLDVDMPRGSGFDLLERFPIRKFDVIFISAYSKFAVVSPFVCNEFFFQIQRYSFFCFFL